MAKKKNNFTKFIKNQTENSITLDCNKMMLEGAGKLGRHNTSQKSHVHRSLKDYDRNSKSSKRGLHALQSKYM